MPQHGRTTEDRRVNDELAPTASAFHTRGERRVAPRRGARSVTRTYAVRVLIVVGVLVEILGAASLIMGPLRFDHMVVLAVSQAEFQAIRLGSQIPLSPRADTRNLDGQPANTPFMTVVSRVQGAETSEALGNFAESVSVTTWLGAEAFRGVVPARAVVPWLAEDVPHLHFSQERVDRLAGEEIETVWGTSDDLASAGLDSYDVIFRVRSSQGRITEISAYYDPLARERIRPMSTASRRSTAALGSGVALAGVALALPGVLAIGYALAARRRRRVAFIGLALPVALLLLGFATSLGDPAGNDLSDFLPDPILYTLHGAAGSMLESSNAPPRLVAIQWIKAASHAKTPAEVTRAARGIAAARERTGDVASLDLVLCGIGEHGSPNVQNALAEADLRCGA